MGSAKLLNIEPLELKFPFELKKQISCSFQLSNKTDTYVAFKVKTTNPKKYSVRPSTGIVSPQSACTVLVIMQAQKEAPPKMYCKDKFLIQSVISSPSTTPDLIDTEMFNKEMGVHVEECKLRVVYVSTPQLPSTVPEEREKSLSPQPSFLDTENSNGYDVAAASDLVTKMSAEVISLIQQTTKLLQDLELLRSESKTDRGGFSVLFITFVGLLGIVLGYHMKKI